MEKSTIIYQLSESDVNAIAERAAERALAKAKEKLSSENDDRLLKRDETAKALGVTTVTLWRWAQQGVLVPIKMGSKSCYKWSEVKEFMNKGC